MCTTYGKEHAKLSTCISEDEGSIGWFASLKKNTDFFLLVLIMHCEFVSGEKSIVKVLINCSYQSGAICKHIDKNLALSS